MNLGFRLTFTVHEKKPCGFATGSFLVHRSCTEPSYLPDYQN